MGSQWILLATLAGISSNISNFFSRYLLKESEDIALYSWFFEFSRFAVFLLLLYFDFSFKFSLYNILFLLVMGIIECAANYLYMQMHAYTHLSVSAVVSRTRFIWIPVIAYLFLGERLKISVYIGIVLIFIGLAIVKSPHKLFIDKGLQYAYISAFLIAITTVMLDKGVAFSSTMVLLVFLTFPSSIIIPLTIKNPAKRFKRFFSRNLSKKLFAAFFNLAAVYLFTIALKSGPVSIVSAIYNSALILAVIAGILFLGEKEDIVNKIIGTIFATTGIIFLTFL